MKWEKVSRRIRFSERMHQDRNGWHKEFEFQYNASLLIPCWVTACICRDYEKGLIYTQKMI